MRKSEVIILVMVLITGSLSVYQPAVGKIEFVGMWILATIFFMDYCRQRQRADRWMNRHFEVIRRVGWEDLETRVCNLPKVTSATGQIYVDLEDVTRILRGEDIVER